MTTDNSTITRQDVAGLMLTRQPAPGRVLTRQRAVPGAVAANARFEDGASVFDPTTISSLAHRWRVNRAASRYSDLGGTVAASSGDPLGVLADEVGSANLAAPSTSARPALATVGSTVVAQFDGVDDAIDTATNALSLTGEATVWMLAAMPATGRVFDRVAVGNTRRVNANVSANEISWYSSGAVGTATAPPAGQYATTTVTTGPSGAASGFLEAEEGASVTSQFSEGVADLRVGADNTLSSHSDMVLVECMVFDKALTQAEIKDLRSYAADTYGSDLGMWAADDLRTTLGLLEYLDARDLSLTDGDPVATWGTDWRTAADAAQTTAADRPTYRASGVGTGPALEFDGVSDNMSQSPTMTETTRTHHALIRIDSLAGDQRIFDCQNGRLLIQVQSSGALRVLSGSSGYVSTGVTLSAGEDYVVTLRFRAGDSQFDVWLDGNEEATNVTYDPVEFRSSTRLCSGVGADREWLDGKFGLHAVYGRALTDSEIESHAAYLRAEWGIA